MTGADMFRFRLVRKYQRWLIGFVLIALLYIFLFKWPSSRMLIYRPWVDTNQQDFDMRVNFKDFNHSYQFYSSRHRDLCEGKRVLVLVASSPANFKRRKEARRSWAKKENIPDDYLVQFFIGAQSNYDTEIDMYVEKHDFDDILRCSLPDTYENLVFKTHAMLAWHRELCPDVKYLIKVDDDTVVDLKRLDHFIRNDFELSVDTEKPAIFCKAYYGVAPYRTPWSKWYVSRQTYSENTFPTYCSGGIYLMTTPTVFSLLRETEKINLIQIEDIVFTGVLPKRLNISVHSSEAFCNKQNEHDSKCSSDQVPFHSSQCDVPEQHISKTYDDLQKIRCSQSESKNSSFAVQNSIILLLFLSFLVFIC